MEEKKKKEEEEEEEEEEKKKYNDATERSPTDQPVSYFPRPVTCPPP